MDGRSGWVLVWDNGRLAGVFRVTTSAIHDDFCFPRWAWRRTCLGKVDLDATVIMIRGKWHDCE
jgi:hypothetical protein